MAQQVDENDLKLLNEYRSFRRINSIEEIMRLSTFELPQQCAVLHKFPCHYFHHFIILSVTESTIVVVHKINRNMKQILKELVLAEENEDCITEIKKEEIYVNSSGKITNDPNNLLKLKYGLYFLGIYSYMERKTAEERSLSAIGKKEVYSVKSSNCEHFTNWCFQGNSISYEADIREKKALHVDTFLDAAKDIIKIGTTPIRDALNKLKK